MFEFLRKLFESLFGGKPQPQLEAFNAAPTSEASDKLNLALNVNVNVSPITVAIVNSCSVLTDAQVAPVVAALQVQVTTHFAPVYGIGAKLVHVKKGQRAPAGAWQLVLLDTSDQAGALGYHDLTSDGLPLGKAFIKTDMDNGAIWSVTVSHELLEMLADPWINLTVFVQSDDTKGVLYAYEVCDACEADKYAYRINGVLVSDFVYPRWFGVPGSKTKIDHVDSLAHPLSLLPGGYIGKFDVTSGGGWTQVTADKVLHQHRNDFKTGSRRDKRARGHHTWKKSTV